jgi:hypothetical protein
LPFRDDCRAFCASRSVARLGAGIIDRISRRECMCFIVYSILAQLIWRSSRGVISNRVHVSDSAWPATI